MYCKCIPCGICCACAPQATANCHCVWHSVNGKRWGERLTGDWGRSDAEETTTAASTGALVARVGTTTVHNLRHVPRDQVREGCRTGYIQFILLFFFRICIRKSSCRLNQLQLTLGTACCIPIPMTLVESSSSKRRVQSWWHTIRQAGGGWANVGCATCATLDCASLQLAAAVVAHAVTERGGATNWEVKALEGRLWNTL